MCNPKWTPITSLKSNRRALSTCSALKQPNHRWTASERAQRVAQDNNLQGLLNAEVKQSGYVTAAGYKAVLHTFLYSDVVEKEMNHNGNNEAHIRKSKSGRFDSLISGMTASTVSASLSSSNFSSSMTTTTSQPQMTLFRRLRSGDSKRSSICHRSSNLSTLDDVPITSNLAPRRTSVEGPTSLTEVQRRTLRQESKHQRSPVKFAEVNFDPQDTTRNDTMTKRTMCKKEVPTIVTAKNEEDSFDPQDTSRRAELLQHLLYADKSEWLPWPKQHGDDDSSDCSSLSSTSLYDDNDCGWLPWPEQRYGSRADDECSKYSKNEENKSFLPRPGTPIKNGRASAA